MPIVKYQVRFFCQLLKVLGNFSIIYFVFRKASKGLKKGTDAKDHYYRMRLLNWTLFTNITVNIILMIILEVLLFELYDEYRD